MKFQEVPRDSRAFLCHGLARRMKAASSMSRLYFQKFDWTKNKKQLLMKNLLLNPPSNQIQHVLLKGSVGSGKSTAIIAWAFENVLNRYPGSKWLVMRRTHGQIMGSIWEQINDFNRDYGIPVERIRSSKSAGPPEIVYPNGSKWVFWSSESVVDRIGGDTARGLGGTQYSGCTLEEPDRIHVEAINTIPNRLREKSGVQTRVIFYSANPTPVGHWLHRKFEGDSNTKPTENMHSITMTMWDNIAWLPDGYIESQQEAYRDQPGLYRRMVLGQWGPELKGRPYYTNYFNREFHVSKISFIATWKEAERWKDGPVCLCWDFGQARPALVVFQDVSIGETFRQIRVLAGFLGDHVTLRIFAKYYLDEIYKLLPGAEFLTYCDPAGKQNDPRGVTQETAIDVLRSLQLNPNFKKSEIKGGVDLIIKLLQETINHRLLGMQPAIIIEPNPLYTEDIVDMFDIGYAQEEETAKGEFKPHHDQYYIHLADAFRYGVIHRRRLDESNNLDSHRPAQYIRPSEDMLGAGLYIATPMDMERILGPGWNGNPATQVASYNF